jgi:hypothetical protein
MDMIDLLATEETKNYKCYFYLKHLIKENEEFRNILSEGLKEGKVSGFDDSMWLKIKLQNPRSNLTFEDAFKLGYNLGNCTGCAIQYSYSLDYPYICGGELPLLKGTQNSPDGRHTWIESNGKIIDTTLMLVMDKDFAMKLGYKEENRRNPNLEPRYIAAKDFITDPSIRAGRKI